MIESLKRVARRVLPRRMKTALWTVASGSTYVPVGYVRFGSLRRRAPISRHFGYDRGTPIDRYYVERFLERQAADIRGRVLEFGDNEYTRRFGGERVTRSDVLHPTADNPHATIVGDLADPASLPEGEFDCIVCTQTLHLIYNIDAAVRGLRRMLRPGGVLLATFPGLSPISDVEWRRHWYWSLTEYSAQRLFGDVFGASAVRVEVHGNVLSTTAFMHGLAAGELRHEELEFHDPDYQMLIAVRAGAEG
jgi:SAM-dependent methyltransferase